MINRELVYNVARAQYLRRGMEGIDIADVVWTSESDNLNEYNVWASMSESDKKIWIDKAEIWLLTLIKNRPINYEILEKGFLHVE